MANIFKYVPGKNYTNSQLLFKCYPINNFMRVITLRLKKIKIGTTY